MTFKEKWENYWYHYKVQTILALVIAALIAILTAQCMTAEQYDYSVTLYMAQTVPEQVRRVMAEELAAFGEDLNGDGEVNVEIMDCTYGDNDNARMSQIAKLQARLTLPESILFISDETCYRNLDEMGLFDTLEILPDKEGKGLDLGASPMERAITREVGQFMPESFFISKRLVTGTALEGKAEAAEFEQQAVELLEKLCAAYSEK